MDDNTKEVEEFELHKSVFNNDLKKLTQILKNNKEIIDKKVNFETFFMTYNWYKKVLCFHYLHRISMEIQLYILQQLLDE